MKDTVVKSKVVQENKWLFRETTSQDTSLWYVCTALFKLGLVLSSLF